MSCPKKDSLLRESWNTWWSVEDGKFKYWCWEILLWKRKDLSSASKLFCTGVSMLLESCCIWMHSISAWATASCICSCETWFCRYDMAPTHPYTGSLILAFASYTRLLTASPLWCNGSSCKPKQSKYMLLATTSLVRILPLVALTARLGEVWYMQS